MGFRATATAAMLATALAGLACSKRSEPEAEAVDPPPPVDPMEAVGWPDARPDWKRPLPATPPDGLAEAGYVGAERCKGCHQEIYARYAKHAMARTGMRPLAALDRKWLAEIFDRGAAAAPVRHERSGYAYRPLRRGDDYFVEESLLGADGAPLQRWERKITHVLGAGDYGLALYSAQGSRFWHVPIDYFAEARRWDMDPFAAGGNPRFFSTLGPFCISCHSDYPRRRAGAHGTFLEPMPAGVGCERCHGPGARHAETLAAADLVDLGGLPPVRQVEVCTQCHLESGSVARADRHEFSFRPGEPLDTYRMNFIAEPPARDSAGLLAHSERMVRSTCWSASGRTLTCTSCHDPHAPSAAQPAAEWDRRCNTCHADKPCTEKPEVRAAAGGHCVGCHMQQGPPAEVPHVVITDHWIQRRPVPLRAGRRSPPKQIIPWHALVGDQMPLAADTRGVLTAGHAQAGMMDAAVALAPGALSDHPRVRELYTFSARYFKGRGRSDLAARAWAAILAFDADDRGALIGYATTTLDVGAADASAEATRALDRLLAVDPDDQRGLELLGMMRFRAGQTDAARVLFERAAAAGPGAASARVGLAALALRAGKPAEAIAHLQVVRYIEPGDSWVLDRLEAALRQTGDGDGAGEVAALRAGLTALQRPPRVTDASGWLPDGWR